MIQEVLTSQSATDGSEVRLKRVLGGRDLDPFLMLDEFGSLDVADCIGGVLSHPHRGFETVTYMLEAHMEHRDHMTTLGCLGPSDVQWKKSGKGVIHSEMPQQDGGRLRGFRGWIKLPTTEKMTSCTIKISGLGIFLSIRLIK